MLAMDSQSEGSKEQSPLLQDTGGRKDKSGSLAEVCALTLLFDDQKGIWPAKICATYILLRNKCRKVNLKHWKDHLLALSYLSALPDSDGALTLLQCL